MAKDESDLLGIKYGRRPAAEDDLESVELLSEDETAAPEVDYDHIATAVEAYKNPAAQQQLANSGTADSTIGMALLAAIPTLAGGLLGGAGGVAAGAQIGQQAVGNYQGQLDRQRQLQVEQAKLKQKQIDAQESEKRKFAQQEKMAKFTQGEANKRAVENRGAIVEAARTRASIDAEERQQDKTLDILKARESDPVTVETKKVENAAAPILEIASTPWSELKNNAPAQLAMLTANYKLYDPSTGVKEGELRNIEGARSVRDSLAAWKNKLENGGFLTEGEVAKIAGVAKRIVQSRNEALKRNDERYSSWSNQLKLKNPPVFTVNSAPQSQREVAAPSVGGFDLEELRREKARRMQKR